MRGYVRTAALVVLAMTARRVDAQAPARCPELPCDSIRLRIHPLPQEIKLRLDSLMRVLADEPIGSPDRLRIDKALFGLMTEMADVMPMGMIEAHTLVDAPRMKIVRPKGWIGLSMDAAPHQMLVSDSGLIIRYFEHPSVISVDPDSPAERSGIARGDLVLAYNGADVTERPINLTALLQPSQQVTVRVRRGGDVRDFGVLVGKAPEGAALQSDDAPERMKQVFLFQAPFDGVFQPSVIGANSLFGAILSSVDAESGRAYGVQAGLLVNSAPEGTPARESGLRGGDVIVRAAGEPVTSLSQFRAILRRHVGERVLPVEVERDRKVVPVALTWSAR